MIVIEIVKSAGNVCKSGFIYNQLKLREVVSYIDYSTHSEITNNAS